MNQKSIKYLSGYITVTDDLKKKIEKHAARYNIVPAICAWYSNWEDFFSYRSDNLGYTKTEARKILHGGIGEFMKLPKNLGIVRFAL